jgi:F0F1-type ATP synthase delta subunit
MITQILYSGLVAGLIGVGSVSLFKFGKYSQRKQLEGLIKNPDVSNEVKEEAVEHLIKHQSFYNTDKDWLEKQIH